MEPGEQSYMLCLFPGSFRANLSPLKLRLLPNHDGLDDSSLYWKLRGPNDAYYVSHDELCSKRGLYFYSFSDQNLENLDIHIDIIMGKVDSSSCCVVGQCALVSSEFMDTKGLIRRPLISKDILIVGELVFEYLIVRPWLPSVKNMREYLYAIKLNYTLPLLVGHRGKGAHSKSYVQENTLLSFLSATRDKRVKFIELDVQLSADGHPIVFHDFLITRKTQQLDLDDMDIRKVERYPTIAVGSLSLKDFQRMAIYREGAAVTFYDSDHETRESNGYHLRSKTSHGGRRNGTRSHSNSSSRSSSITSDLSGIASHRSSDSDRDDMDEIPSLIEDHLPSLDEVLMKMPVDVGFFLEMKYPCPDYQQRKKLVVPDRNVFVDAVLDCVCKSFVEKKQRTIVFLSFDPDICYLLKCKQEYFPVLLLCSETRFSSDDHFDLRTMDIQNAVNWSIHQKLDGMAILSDILFEKPNIVSELKNNGLKVFCFGAITSQEDKAKNLIKLGVDGLIADNVTCLAKKLCDIL
ncbi:Glycerophosphodiester phosphodiesterase GDE1 [Galdieria sulphuraria]|nr:Glycerophosphodiester phosphodiesterase GDE1 [Galdieria sulphuraria]